jgi:hypothetical protein
MEVPMRSWIRDPSRNFDITPDGKRFVTVVESASGETNVPRVEVVLNWFEDVKRLVPVK